MSIWTAHLRALIFNDKRLVCYTWAIGWYDVVYLGLDEPVPLIFDYLKTPHPEGGWFMRKK